MWAAIHIINKSASRSIWITMEIFLAPSWIQTHRGRVMQIMKQALYLQATSAGFFIKYFVFIELRINFMKSKSNAKQVKIF